MAADPNYIRLSKSAVNISIGNNCSKEIIIAMYSESITSVDLKASRKGT